MAESQQLVLIQHHFLQKKLFSQKPGARFKSRVFKTQILSPHMYTWLTPAVFSFKMLVIQADSEILSVPLQASYSFRKSSCFIHEIKSRSS